MQAELPLISVIVVTYNSSQYVLETLESVRLQTYSRIELIISDDCSTDETVRLCNHWLMENKSRFEYSELITTEKNTGIPANCNRGFKAAKGVWLKGIAGDDALLPECLELNFRFAIDNKTPIVLSEMELYANEFKPEFFSGYWKINTNDLFFSSETTTKFQFKQLLKADKIGNTATLFVKKSVCEEVNYFDERFRHIEDYPFWIKLTGMNYKLCFMGKATVKYRKHELSIHNNHNEYFMRPVYFKNEAIRKVYVYPHLNFTEYIYQKYCYYLALLFVSMNRNKFNLNQFRLYNLLTFKSDIYKFIKV